MFLGHFWLWICVVNAYRARFACYICLSRCGAGGGGFSWVVGHCQLSGTKGERVFARKVV